MSEKEPLMWQAFKRFSKSKKIYGRMELGYEKDFRYVDGGDAEGF